MTLSSILLALCALSSIDSVKTHHLDEVVVTGSRSASETHTLPMTITTINNNQLNEYHNSSVLPSLTKHVPGLFTTGRGLLGYGVAGNGSGRVYMRGIGASPNTDVMVLIDGIPQIASLMGHPVPDAYLTSITDKIEVVSGPSSMLYGSNAMGGVINILSHNIKNDGLKSEVNILGGSYGTIESSFSNQIQKGKFNSFVSVDYSTTDGHRKDSEFNQFNSMLKLQYKINDNWKMSLMGNFTHFYLQNPGEINNPYINCNQNINRVSSILAANNNYTKTSGTFSLYYNMGHHYINDGYHPTSTPLAYRFKSNDAMFGICTYQNFNLFNGNITTIGFDYQHMFGNAWNYFLETHDKQEIVDKNIDEIAGYVNVSQNITHNFTINTGARVDNHSVAGTEFIPQFGLTYHLPHNINLKAIVSKGFRNPTIKELYMFAARNPELKPQRLMNYEFSYNQTFNNEKIQIGANIFYMEAKNLIQTIKVDGKAHNVNLGKSYHSGFEMYGTFRWNKILSTDINYSYLCVNKSVLSSPKHKVNIMTDFSFKRWEIHPSVSYISGLYTIIDENSKKEHYCLVDCALDYKLMQEIKIFAKGENLFAQSYEIYNGFPMPKATFMAGINITF